MSEGVCDSEYRDPQDRLWRCILDKGHPGKCNASQSLTGVSWQRTCPSQFKVTPRGSYKLCSLAEGHTDLHKSLDGTLWTAAQAMPDADVDNINHPKHYNSHPSGIECIVIAEHHNFNIGNVLKYLWRAGLKSVPVSAHAAAGTTPIDKVAEVTDLKKARWYLDREIQRLENP